MLAWAADVLDLPGTTLYHIRNATAIVADLVAGGFSSDQLPASRSHALELETLSASQRVETWRAVLSRKQAPSVAGIRLVKANLYGAPALVQADGTLPAELPDDLAALMQNLDPATAAKVIEIAEQHARKKVQQEERQQAAECPWLAELRTVKTLLKRLEPKPELSSSVAQAKELLHRLWALLVKLDNKRRPDYERDARKRARAAAGGPAAARTRWRGSWSEQSASG